MILVPYSKTVFVAVEGKGKSNPTSVEFKVLGVKSSRYVASVTLMGIGKIDKAAKKPLKDTIVAPYWLVRRVLDKSMANMRKNTMLCLMTTDAGDETATQPVTLPILHNIKEVKSGDELLLYVDPVVPDKIMPAQSLAQVNMKRPAATVAKMQKARKKS